MIAPARALLKLQLNPVLFVAVVEYAVVVVPFVSWHVGSPDEVMAVGVPTVGVIFTVRFTIDDGPLQPLAVTWISTVPENPFAQVITPVPALIVPANALLKLQLNPVLFVAVVEYVVVVVPFVSWHVGSPDEVMAVGVPTVGVMFTVRLTIDDGPLQPLAVTWISTVPENPFAQVITPVPALIAPARALLKLQLNPVLFVAVVEYAVVVVPFVSWHVGSPTAVMAVGVPTVGVIFTVRFTIDDGPLQPLAVTWISTVPENPFAQVITPVPALIAPARALLKLQLNPVLFVAVVEYAVVVVPFVSWHAGSPDEVMAVGVPTVGVIFTVRFTIDDGPLQPLAVTWISTVPENPFAQVITPVPALIAPARALLKLQLNPVLFVAVVEYAVVVVPFVSWHVGSPDEVMAVGVPTVGVIFTVRLTIDDGPLQPLAVTWISTVPENPFAQVITPVPALIVPANALLKLQLNPVLFVAVVEYVVVVVPFVSWHVGSPDEVMAVGVPTVGVIFTVRFTIDDGPLQPLAVTWISTVPENPFAHVITPVPALIAPARALLKLQLNPVLFVAVVEYVVVVVPFVSWHVGSPDEVMAVGVPTVGVMFTVRFTIDDGPLQPLAVTWISTVPENPFAQVITPVPALIAPARALLKLQLNPVLFVAVVEYAVVVVPFVSWHAGSPDEVMAVGVPTVGVIFTVRFTIDDGPLQPLAVTWISTVPENPFAQVITPVPALIAPARALLKLQLNPVLFVAVVEYAVVVVPFVSWHVGSPDEVMAVGVPTVGVMFTVRFTIDDGPLQPLAVTWISTVPENPFAQVITPVPALIAPARALLKLQLNPVLFVAVVEYVVVVVPFVSWHVGSPDEVMAVGVPTVGVIFTVRFTIDDGPLQPLAVTWISTVPENPFAQVITPVPALIAPARALLKLQLNPVLFVAVVEYAVVVVPFVSWHVGSPDEVMAVGVPTVGVIFTVRFTIVDGPLQPLAVTWISTDPEKPFAQVITPVPALIAPARALLKLQLNPVLFVAVVEYAVVVVPFVSWHVGSPTAVMAVGVPTVGVIFTVRFTIDDGPLQPLAVTWISTVPEKPFAQVITPVPALIAPARALLKLQLNPVLFVAVVEYVVVVVPFVSWHVGSPDEVMAVGVPTVGVMVTEIVCAGLPGPQPFSG